MSVCGHISLKIIFNQIAVFVASYEKFCVRRSGVAFAAAAVTVAVTLADGVESSSLLCPT